VEVVKVIPLNPKFEGPRYEVATIPHTGGESRYETVFEDELFDPVVSIGKALEAGKLATAEALPPVATLKKPEPDLLMELSAAAEICSRTMANARSEKAHFDALIAAIDLLRSNGYKVTK
jgi:hypothetical protein